MFKIIIADDEGAIRRGIISILKRNISEDLEIYEAETGYEALNFVRNIDPALIITDIRMPGVSGLDFIETLRKNNQNTAVIIISGYEDFKYAQKAIALGVKKYITKPVDKQELIELVSLELQARKNRFLNQKKEVNKTIASKAVQKELCETLLLQLLNTIKKEEVRQTIKRLEKLQVKFRATLYTCVVVQYYSAAPLDFLDFSIPNIVEEYLRDSVYIDYLGGVKYSKSQYVFLLAGEETKHFHSAIQTLFTEIAKKLIEYYHCDIFIGVGTIIYETDLMNRALSTAIKAVDYKIFDKERHIQCYSRLEKGTTPNADLLQKLQTSILSMNGTLIAQGFSMFTKTPYTKRNMQSFQEMYQLLESELHHHICICQHNSTRSLPALCSFRELWSIPELNRSILSFVTAIQDMAQNILVSASNQKLLSDIICYIREHLTEMIDLNTVSDTFGKNPAYISSLFKKGMQEGFNEYITRERVNLSLTYLKDSSIPINEVARRCGYGNSKYYSVVFKKITGFTPKEYREKTVLPFSGHDSK